MVQHCFSISLGLSVDQYICLAHRDIQRVHYTHTVVQRVHYAHTVVQCVSYAHTIDRCVIISDSFGVAVCIIHGIDNCVASACKKAQLDAMVGAARRRAWRPRCDSAIRVYDHCCANRCRAADCVGKRGRPATTARPIGPLF